MNVFDSLERVGIVLVNVFESLERAGGRVWMATLNL